MNQRKIDEMIPKAFDALKSSDEKIKQMIVDDYKIKKVYFGYIAAFGPSVIQSGIAKTLAFYDNKSRNSEDEQNNRRTEGDRSAILELIKLVFYAGNPELRTEYKGVGLFDIFKENTFTTLDRLALTDKILEAAIACKLVMNTYKKDETENHES